MRAAELFLDHGAQIIALDWSASGESRLAADGKQPGFPHVYISAANMPMCHWRRRLAR